MGAEDFTVRLERITSVRERSLALFQRMTQDPSRPYWQIEMTSLLYETLCILDQIETGISVWPDLISTYEKRISSLETRYSQLLYSIKAQQQ